jgi:hypothetical protein
LIIAFLTCTLEIMRRREFLQAAGAGLSGRTAKVRVVTSGGKHHFFGYYGITPWNRSGKYMVCLESDFQDHLPKPEEAAGIGLVDTKTGAWRRIGETRAWNFQQGAMLHWNPLKAESEILFNERRGTEIISAALDVDTGRRRELPRAINGVSRSGRHALCLTYGRLTRLRPVVGYVGAVDPNADAAHPNNDGVFVMDLATGRARLAVPIAEIYERLVVRHPELKERHMWFNHTVFNKSGTRFFFLARCWAAPGVLESAMFTANLDGEELREVIPFGKGVSHFEWRNDREIMATFRLLEGREKQHVLFTDGAVDYRHIGAGFLKSDGHCSFAPDEEWMATDENVGSRLEKRLLLYNVRTNEQAVLGAFPMRTREFMGGDLRCDLHPRWNRDGTAICIDALAADGTRQLHGGTRE